MPRTIILHNGISDLATLIRNGHTLPETVQWWDTYVATAWCWPFESSHGLEHLVLKSTNYAEWRPTIGKLDIEQFEAMDAEALRLRCGRDAQAAYKLYERVAPEIHEQGLTKIFALAMDVLPILAEMGGRGMQINWELLKRREKKYAVTLEKIKQAIEIRLGIENLDSRQQLSRALFGPRFRAAKHKKTLDGYSTDQESLLWAQYQATQKNNHRLSKIIGHLLTFSEWKKLHSTYYLPWLETYTTDHRVHSFYSLGKTSTGRLSSSETNLQNIPKLVRRCIIPSVGFDYLIQCDHSQLELRTAAYLSRDANLTQWIKEGRDLHCQTAAKVLGLPAPRTKQEVAEFKLKYPDERASGKLVNFSSLYGITSKSLPWKIFKDTEGKILITEELAQKYIDAFFTSFAGYKEYTLKLWQDITEGKWIVSPTGRRWLFPATSAGWRQGQNYPNQSFASDLTVLGLRELYRALKKYKLKTRLIGEVHDSVLLESPKNERSTIIQLVPEILEHPPTQREFGFTMDVPLKVDVQIGENWQELEAI